MCESNQQPIQPTTTCLNKVRTNSSCVATYRHDGLSRLPCWVVVSIQLEPVENLHWLFTRVWRKVQLFVFGAQDGRAQSTANTTHMTQDGTTWHGMHSSGVRRRQC